MSKSVKRTYNLAPATVQRVKELAEQYGAARSQDAVIELAVDELERRLREQRESVLWEVAASDPEFAAEVDRYADVDTETWPA